MSDRRALFGSAHQALLFAYTYGDIQHATAGGVERRIAESSKDRYGRLAASGRGLRGLDGAAQAGMIRSLVERNTPRPFSVACVGRFAVLDQGSQRAAAACLALRARQYLPPGVPAWAVVELMQGALGQRVNLPHVADRCDVDVRTVRRWRLAVRHYLAGIEGPGMVQAEVLLEDRGIVERAAGCVGPAATPDPRSVLLPVSEIGG